MSKKEVTAPVKKNQDIVLEVTDLGSRGEGIGLFEMLQLIGKEKTLARLTAAAEKFCL